MPRNYRIIRIAGLHFTTAMNHLYKIQPGLKLRSYSEQQAVLFHNAMTYGDSFSQGMQSLGNDAWEIVYDLEILQKKWAEENNIKFSSENWRQEIILAQIEHFRPDVVYFQDVNSLSPENRRSLKSRFPFIKLIVIFRGFPKITPDLLQHLSSADILLAGSPLLLNKFKELNPDTHLVYHFFDPNILKKIRPHTIQYDFTFIGSSGYRYGHDHKARYWFLMDLLEKTNLELWVDERGQHDHLSMSGKLKRALRATLKTALKQLPSNMLNNSNLNIPMKLQRLVQEIMMEKQLFIGKDDFHSKKQTAIPSSPIDTLFKERCHTPVFGLPMYELLQQSKITFNKHSTPAQGTVDNIRLFHATGMGACLLTDTGSNMSDLFEEDREVVTYSCIEECIEKVNFLLNNESIRKEIAKKGQEKTLKEHSVERRCQQIDEIIQAKLL